MGHPTDRRPVIGLLLNSLFDGYEAAVWNGVVRAAEELDVDLLCFLGGSLGDGSRRSSLFELVQPETVDALVVLSASVGIIGGTPEVAAMVSRMAPLPAVSVSEPLPGVPSILADNAAGISAAVDHLVLHHGRRRIAWVGGPPSSSEASLRYAAYESALARHGLALDPALLVDGDWSPASGLQAVRTLAQREVPFDALLCSNDLMALAALEELRRTGVDVPRHVSVCGFDDIVDTASATPPLTTVRQPLAEMAREAVRRALAVVRGGEVEARVCFPAELVVRGSCGCTAPPAEPPGGTAPLHRPGRAEDETRVLHRLILPFPLPEDAFLRNLPPALDQLGVRSFFLSRYRSPDLREATLLLHHDLDRISALDEDATAFPASRLIPGRFVGARRRAHAVLPVQSPDGPIGFALCEIGPMMSAGYEVLMHQISTVMSFNGLIARIRDQEHQFVEAARRAGMAEMAVGTLHNVGNLLNTVSVCAEQITTLVDPATAEGLRRAIGLLTAHRDDLAGFFGRDARAALLPEYLERISQQVEQQQRRVGQEADLLLERVKVIRDTIRGLQDLAREGGSPLLRERIDLRALVAAVVQNQAPSLEREGIALEQEEDGSTPIVVSDRAKVLHVLVNLVKNAVEAMRGIDRERTLRLSIAASGPDRVRVVTRDTGEGIAPENLERVFAFGFTTKPDGHGFGLHTCALYARQLGGSLQVSSPGRGLGATFTLELPRGQASAAARGAA